MIVTLEEMKQYLRVDFPDDANALTSEPNAKTAVLYTVAYLYEHREDADHHALMITLRALLFGSRREGF